LSQAIHQEITLPDVQAVILAGGKGTRLRPVTAELPKPLIPIANRPLIDHQLRHLAASGIRDITLALSGASRTPHTTSISTCASSWSRDLWGLAGRCVGAPIRAPSTSGRCCG
jgi:hypothetical protein